MNEQERKQVEEAVERENVRAMVDGGATLEDYQLATPILVESINKAWACLFVVEDIEACMKLQGAIYSVLADERGVTQSARRMAGDLMIQADKREKKDDQKD